MCAALAALFAFGVAEESALAGHPADAFKGQVITAKKRLPTSAKSKSAYVAKVKKLKEKKFWENKEKKNWKIYFAAFLRRPLNDLEVTVQIYDVTEGKRKLVTSFEQYLDRKGQRVINSYMTLEREQLGVNRKLELHVRNRGKTLAKGNFQILGEAEKYSGKVDFTDE